MPGAVRPDPAQILRAREFDVVPYAPRVAALSARLGLDLGATVRALQNLPLCQARGRHKDTRRAIARMIASRAPALERAMPDMVARRLRVLQRPGRVEVMEAVIDPLVSEILTRLVGTPLDVAEFPAISRVFSQSLGVSRRRRMNAALERLEAQIAAAFPNAEADEIGRRLSLAILGRDALAGTLGCSLHHLASAAAGRGWQALDWPKIPPRTGVPYVDRMAVAPVTYEGAALAPGDCVRLRLDAYESHPDPQQRLGFFGSGAHLCLGRALTLSAYAQVVAVLAASPARPRVVDYTLRRDDVFAIPERFTLEIAAP